MSTIINIYVIRHGSVAAASDAASPLADPGLSAEGQQQAEHSARECMALTGAVPILSSPLLRCRQSAAVLAAAWGTNYHIEPRVTEVPSPMTEAAIRSDWLIRMLPLTWQHMRQQGEQLNQAYPAQLQQWQQQVQQLVQECRQDVVIYSHFFVINSLLSLATRQDQVAASLPAPGAIFHFQRHASSLHLISRGTELSSTPT